MKTVKKQKTNSNFQPKTDYSKQIELLLEYIVISCFPDSCDDLMTEKVSVDRPNDMKFGEYASSIAMKLAKYRKQSPLVIATMLREKIESLKTNPSLITLDQNTFLKDQNTTHLLQVKSILQDIDHVDVVNPGYINFILSTTAFISQLERVLKEQNLYGSSQLAKGRKIMIEYTDPNPFKELHIGHLFSNIIGESFARLKSALGAEVKRADYFGDVGMHVAKSLYGLLNMSNIDNMAEPEAYEHVLKQISILESQSLADRMKYIGEAYILGSTIYEKDERVKSQITKINYLVYISAQRYLVNTYNWIPQVDYKRLIEVNENELAVVTELFKHGREWSLAYFEKIYQRLGTRFDYYYPESIVGEYGAEVVSKGLKLGIFEKSNGAVVYKGEKEGLHTRVFINSLGLPTYETKELGLPIKKFQDFPYDESLIVTGNEINEYFNVLLAALSKLRPDLASKTIHYGHGMVRLPEGKMSSRTGKIVTAEWLIEEAKHMILEKMQESKIDLSDCEKAEASEVLAIASIKYTLLRGKSSGDIVFDIDKSIATEGDSGPYLIYTYARCKSILRKFVELSRNQSEKKHLDEDKQVSSLNSDLIMMLNQVWDEKNITINLEERRLLRSILYFPEIIKEAGTSLSPNTICTYLFTLASEFNNFYGKHTVLRQNTAENSNDYTVRIFRLALVAGIAQVLKNGLDVLGIKVVERM